MRLIILGAPGSGKGTQAMFIKKKFHIPQISTGEILRDIIKSDNKNYLKTRISNDIKKGNLISDDIIIDLVINRLKCSDCINGYLLDGFPRTLSQAHAIKEAGIVIDYILEIYVSDSEIIERISGRRIHIASGRIYHNKFNPPKINGRDDFTGELLIQRDDDTIETIRNRLSIYHKQKKILLDYYKNLKTFKIFGFPRYYKISGSFSIDKVRNNIFSILVKK
ncbi:adenylate kinase [Candidatus Profftella armatura (Diaphorina cf. continua)]|uniref:Adenylate kinase n=1 Tax=Candidatus Profftella armatura (Diaphorina cf. continua) TaxID=2661583 RepID=A0A7R6VZ17_9PROT|nr:adenylate kinase [Candidatus Profftella armatura (Diaphorina cf. continua)]BCG49656.1 adenylate kinase [Candidatus Profftella armatura (Diaphorina cf. continua)]